MIEYLEREGTKICNQISEYARKYKQSINVSKTVAQIFFSQVTIPRINVTMDGQQIKLAKSFKYLAFTWTSKLSLKPTIDKCVENIQKSFIKLKWLRARNTLTTAVLRTCFFAYSFPHFAWLFSLFPLPPKTHQETLRNKFPGRNKACSSMSVYTGAHSIRNDKRKLSRFLCKKIHTEKAKANVQI